MASAIGSGRWIQSASGPSTRWPSTRTGWPGFPTGPRDTIPAKLPADQIDPEARTAVLRTGRRGLQMVLRLLAHNAEHWFANCLNAYLRDDDEYRAITRETIIRGLAGTITFTPAWLTVDLQAPAEPRVARALALVTDEMNASRPPSQATPGPSPTASTGSSEFNTRTCCLSEIWARGQNPRHRRRPGPLRRLGR